MTNFTSKKYVPYLTAILVGVIFGILIFSFINKNNFPAENEINSKKVMEMTELIYDKVNDVIKHSEKNSLSTNSSAIQLAKDRIKENSKK